MDYKRFYEYFMDLYGKNLEVANWHENGELQSLDSFIDSAIDYAEETKPCAGFMI